VDRQRAHTIGAHIAEGHRRGNWNHVFCIAAINFRSLSLPFVTVSKLYRFGIAYGRSKVTFKDEVHREIWRNSE
jgi:hypothetical protein